MPAVDDWVTQWQPQDVHPAGELVEQLLLLTTHAGLREPDAQDKAADVIKAVEALAIGDETFPDVIVRLVNDLESDSTVRKADANVFIASLNIEGDGTGSRQKRSAAVSGGLSDRQLGRNARKVAGALVRRYLASDPAPVPAGVPTRLVELEASLRVPGRFLNPTQVLERRVVEPSHEEMSEWRASIAASLWGDPHFTHFGRGHFEELTHPLLGAGHYERNGFRLSDAASGYGRPSPLLGEHTHQVLADLLGLDDAEIARLSDAGALD